MDELMSGMSPATRAAFERQIRQYRNDYVHWVLEASRLDAEEPEHQHLDPWMKAQAAYEMFQRMEAIVDRISGEYTRREIVAILPNATDGQ